MVIINILMFFLSCVVMVISGSLLVRSLSKIAAYLKINEFIVGFLVMAVSTSIPEFFIGITSALEGNTALALGTSIGSNIADMTIVIGIVVILSRGIKVNSENTKKDAMYMFFIALLPIALMLIGGSLSRIDGMILIGVFVLYTYKLVMQRKGFKKEIGGNMSHWSVLINFSLIVFSIILLFFSSDLVVNYSTALSIDFALPPILIGLFLIALGTSLPELIFDIQAVLKKHSEMALGDIIGSVVTNSTLVLGVTALILPIQAPFIFFISSSMFMAVMCFLFATFVESGNELSWKEGIAMVLLYSFFLMIEFYIKTVGS